MSSARYCHVSPKGKFRQLATREECLAALKADGYGWLDLVDPTREDLEALREPLGLHPISIEDCLDEDHIPKINDFPSNTFVLFNRYDYRAEVFSVDEVDFFLGKNFLVSVNRSRNGAAEFYAKLEQAVTLNVKDVARGPDLLLHVILDYIVDRKFESIEALQERLDEAEESILNDPTAFKPNVLMCLRRYLLDLRKSIFHEREILIRICRRDSPFVDEKSIYHFRDIYDHLAKFYEVAEMYREMISNLMETYLSMVNCRMSQVANRMSGSMRRLTLITTVFMPLTLFAGIGGMSEWSMMTGPENWRYTYPAFMGAMLVVAAVNYWVLLWVEKKDPGPGW